jgi:hypothetical protein
MQKIGIILLVVMLVSGAALAAISLPVAEDVSSLPFTMEDDTQGKIRITSPLYLRLGDKASLRLEVAFVPDTLTAMGANVKLKSNLQSFTLEMNPSTAVTATIASTGTSQFTWEITGHSREPQQVTVWCFRQGIAGPELILARDLTFEVKTILGLQFSLSRWILGGILIFCLLLLSMAIYLRRSKA